MWARAAFAAFVVLFSASMSDGYRQQGQLQIGRLNQFFPEWERTARPFSGPYNRTDGHLIRGITAAFAVRETIGNTTDDDRDHIFDPSGRCGCSLAFGKQVTDLLGCRAIGENGVTQAWLTCAYNFFFIEKIKRPDAGVKLDRRLHSRRMAAVSEVKFKRDMQTLTIVNNGPGNRNIGRENPWSPLGIHSIQLPLHDAKLAIESNVLRGPDSDGYESEERYGPSRPSRTVGRTICGALFLLFGAALLKLAFYFGDTPCPRRDDRCLTWGTGIVAALLIGQGTILVLSGNWLP